MKKTAFFALLLLLSGTGRANNIQVTNISTVPASNTIRFTVSWENGWRSTILNNWDAAWVFLKYYEPQTAEWRHLNFTNAGNSIPVGYSASFGSEVGVGNVGVFLYRSAAGAGATNITNVELGIPAQQATGVYDIKVFAIEMVYVPQGSFYAGDGSALSGTERYRANFSTNPNPAMVLSSSAADLYDPLASNVLGFGILNNNFPTGYRAFYCMKYELTQGAYRDFLNSLNYTGQANHTLVAPNSATGTAALAASNRNYIEVQTPGANPVPAVYGCDADGDNIFNEANDGEWVACNYVNWPDMAAYLAWSGLRPLSELEFEKACRGIQLPAGGEYAWGGTTIATVIYVLNNPGEAAEVAGNAPVGSTGNANYGTTYPNPPLAGPLRNGIFATATSNRISSGGSFYGIMEMSGNLSERVITTSQATGQDFTGSHGIGVLAPNGYAAMTNWPGYNLGTTYIDGGINATGLIRRGGSWNSSTADPLRVSYRAASQLVLTPDLVRDAYSGIRGGRTAQ